MRRIDADKIKAESRVLCDSCTLRGTEKCTDICVVNLICKRVDLQPTVEATTIPEGDLISREALKRAIEDRIDYIPASDYDEGWNNAINTAIDEIVNAPTVEGKLSDKQIEEIADLLETEWGYEGIREDVTRILKGGAT